MAGSAEGEVAAAAKENSHVTAPHAFPVNELVSVLLAELFAVAKLLHRTFFAHEVFRLEIIRILRFHSLGTVLHAAKVGILALEALVECALVQGVLGQFAIVDIAFGHDSTLSVVALLYSYLLAEAGDSLL